jgi:hypothetical protein
MADPRNLHLWLDRQRESLVARRRFRCSCGCGKTLIRSSPFERVTYTLCANCGKPLHRLVELPALHSDYC